MNFRSDTRFAAQDTNQVFLSPGFTPCPSFFLSGLTAEQIAWQQAIYAKAYASAQAAHGYQVMIPVFDRVARN